jgi:hypothetical protein
MFAGAAPGSAWTSVKRVPLPPLRFSAWVLSEPDRCSLGEQHPERVAGGKHSGRDLVSAEGHILRVSNIDEMSVDVITLLDEDLAGPRLWNVLLLARDMWQRLAPVTASGSFHDFCPLL